MGRSADGRGEASLAFRLPPPFRTQNEGLLLLGLRLVAPAEPHVAAAAAGSHSRRSSTGLFPSPLLRFRARRQEPAAGSLPGQATRTVQAARRRRRQAGYSPPSGRLPGSPSGAAAAAAAVAVLVVFTSLEASKQASGPAKGSRQGATPRPRSTRWGGAVGARPAPGPAPAPPQQAGKKGRERAAAASPGHARRKKRKEGSGPPSQARAGTGREERKDLLGGGRRRGPLLPIAVVWPRC